MLAMAGGGGTLYQAMLATGRPGEPEVTSVPAFLDQAQAYQDSADVMEAVFKVLNLLGTTHPFHVLRAAELRDWIEKGEYDRILRGEYRPRDEDPAPYKEDLAAAAGAYRDDAQHLMRQFGEALRGVRDMFSDGFKPPS
jgi:hypothetical protein